MLIKMSEEMVKLIEGKIGTIYRAISDLEKELVEQHGLGGMAGDFPTVDLKNKAGVIDAIDKYKQSLYNAIRAQEMTEESQPQEVIVYHISHMTPDTEELSCFRIEGKKIDETALDSNELEEKVLGLIERNPKLVIRNKVPIVDIPDVVVTISEADEPENYRSEKLRTLREEEIPERIKPYIRQIKQGEQ